MDRYSASPSANLAEQYQALLEVTESIVVLHDFTDLFHDLAQKLPRIVQCASIALALHDPTKNVMRLHVLEACQLVPVVPVPEYSAEDVPGGWVWQHQRPFVCANVEHETRFPKVMPMVRAAGVRSFYMVPLTTSRRRLGAIGVGSLEEHLYEENEVDFLQQVAKQVAVAVENTLNFESARAAEQELRLLLEINNAVVSQLELPDLLKSVSVCLRRVIPHDLAGIARYDPAIRQLVAHALGFPQHQDFVEVGVPIPIEGTPEGLAFSTRRTVLIKKLDLAEFPAEMVKRAEAEGLKSGCAVPLISHGQVLGTLSVVSLHEGAFTEDDAELLGRIAVQIAIAVENGLAYHELASLKDKLNKEKLYLEGEIRTEHNFEEIIGESPALKQVLKQIEIVAPTDSTVLILGKTGTGKELIARAIHNRSNRRERTFVKMNCAAIPTGLLESELFGHERGAFTGAIAAKVGRFELADGGTLFLDEVGDIPLELQSKLLRVLQEQEFERLGSTRTVRINVRLVAATNRDLVQMVADKEFRSDLYYRLNVFPLAVPPLRERREDIPTLVRYFAQQFARRMNKQIDRIPSEMIMGLSRYDWPGNVRELENLIERAVILSQDSVLNVPLAELKSPLGDKSSPTPTLDAAEREHILQVLKATRWVLGGPSGAAARLGMKRTTLQSKMQRLGITRPV
ncbi:MAG: Formate hydrogenlyase transcriptional activator [Nitrospira sp.]|jgi:formate hydrogenlyase transcriptional activator|nr:MAG: Formate hydrogenlyase transcriptional activator [Nitrospira sp.]